MSDAPAANPRVVALIDRILGTEAGLVDNPKDPGGITNHGVSLRYARDIGLDLNGDGEVDGKDIVLVSVDEARKLFLEDFYLKPRIDTLPEELQPQLADMAVNHGAPRAIILLQEVLHQVRQTAPDLELPPVVADGVVGAKTREAAGKAQAAMHGYLENALAEAREAFMRRLVQQHPDRYDPTFIVARNGGPGGWIKRARSFRVAV